MSRRSWKVLKHGIYVPFYLLLDLVEILLVLLAKLISARFKSIILQLDIVEKVLCNFLLFMKVGLVQDLLEEPYVHDGKLGVATGVLSKLLFYLLQHLDCNSSRLLIGLGFWTDEVDQW